jgi:hypothetical protein
MHASNLKVLPYFFSFVCPCRCIAVVGRGWRPLRKFRADGAMLFQHTLLQSRAWNRLIGIYVHGTQPPAVSRKSILVNVMGCGLLLNMMFLVQPPSCSGHGLPYGAMAIANG